MSATRQAQGAFPLHDLPAAWTSSARARVGYAGRGGIPVLSPARVHSEGRAAVALANPSIMQHHKRYEKFFFFPR